MSEDVAEIVPLPARSKWIPRQRAADSLVQADAALRDELDAALPDTIDQL